MIDVAGYEGAPGEGFLVAWGRAAVHEGDDLVNPATAARTAWSEEELEALAENGDLFVLPRPLPIGDEYLEHHLVVLHIVRFATFAKALYIDTGQAGGILSSRRTGDAHFYVFENQTAFDQIAKKLCTQIVAAVLFDERLKAEERNRLLEAGVVLNSHEPFVNALRVCFSPRPKALREVVSGKLSATSREQFDDMLGSLDLLARAERTPTDTIRAEYVLKYQKGLIPSGGGIDVPVALRAVSAMHAVGGELKQIVAADYPFIEAPSPLHMQALVAASAEFHFTAVGESLGDRLARLIQLRYLARALEGEETRLTPSTLLRLAELGDHTELRHKPSASARCAKSLRSRSWRRKRSGQSPSTCWATSPVSSMRASAWRSRSSQAAA